MSAPSEIRLSRRQRFSRDRTHIVAIFNVTPDSFSGDGILERDEIVARAAEALSQGADVLDVGAESTRPGAVAISEAEELARLLPVVSTLRECFPETVISIDTYKPEVFAQAAALGGDVLNLVRPLDRAHLDVVAANNSALIITQPGVHCSGAEEAVEEVLEYLMRSAERAIAHGIDAERIVLDPGIGFGKTPAQNIALLGSLDRLAALGYPSMLAASRKSTLGLLTGRESAQRDHATSATTALAAMHRLDFVRVHNTAAAYDVVRVCDAVVRRLRE
jgi:dihydropteroate synthase